MKQIILGIFMGTLLLIGEEPQYEEEWSWTTLYINYGHILGNQPFPYHPTRKEFHKAQLKGAKASFDVCVYTEEGAALENATVLGCLAGDPFGNGKDNVVFRKQTDRQGEVHIEGKCGGKIYFSVKKEGWYDSGETVLQFAHTRNISLQDGKWQPYGIKHKIVLRPVKKQIRMYNPVGSFQQDFPKAGEQRGLDLFACDWVAPYGKGETADLFLQYDIREDEKEKLETLTFRFPNPGDGIYRRHCFRHSSYREDYRASEDSSQYQREMILHRKIEYKIRPGFGGKLKKDEILVSQNDLGEEDFLVLRTRTRQDGNGNVTSCHYSKIVRQIRFNKYELSFTWLTNPAENDTNLENAPGQRYTLDEAREAARRKAEQKQALTDVTGIVSRFLETLRSGNLEEAWKCFGVCSWMGECYVRERFAVISPKFVSGELEARVEPKVFLRSCAAIVPIRVWRKGHPERSELRPLVLGRCGTDAPWRLMVNSGKIDDSRNNLCSGTFWDYRELSPLFDGYARNLGQHSAVPDSSPGNGQPLPVKAGQASLPARTEESFLAAGENAEVITAVVKDFIIALKKARKNSAVSAYGSLAGEQAAAMDRWLSKAIPFFSSGEVETAAEPAVWVSGDAAVVPVRQWHPGDPRRIEVELACLILRDGQWRLLPDFEHPFASVNGLDEKARQDFSLLLPLFRQYRDARKREAAGQDQNR